MGSTIKQVLDSGDLNSLAGALKKLLFGTLMQDAALRQVKETVTVTSNAAATTYKVEAVIACTTVTSTTRSRKDPVSNRATLAANQVKGVDSSAVGTKVINFYASEVADASTADVVYWTADPPTNASAVTADYGSSWLCGFVARCEAPTARPRKRRPLSLLLPQPRRLLPRLHLPSTPRH